MHSTLSGVDILPPTSTIIRPKMRQEDPYKDIWSNIFAHHDLLKYTNHELRQLEAEFVTRISNINRRLIHVHPMLDTRAAFNLHVWGSEAFKEWSGQGEYDLIKEQVLTASMNAAAERLNIGLEKRILECERFLWYFVRGKAPDNNDDNWLFNKEDTDYDYFSTRIGYHTGLKISSEKGTPIGGDALEKLSLLDDDPDYGTIKKSEMSTKGSILPRLKAMEAKSGTVVNSMDIMEDPTPNAENTFIIKKVFSDTTHDHDNTITTIKSTNGVDLNFTAQPIITGTSSIDSYERTITIDSSKLLMLNPGSVNNDGNGQNISIKDISITGDINIGSGIIPDISTGTITISGARTITGTGAITLGSARNISITGNQTITGAATISISNPITLNGTGALTISNPITLSGTNGITISGNKTVALGTSTLNITGGAITIANPTTFSGSVGLGSTATATTPTAGNNTTSVATTAFVTTAVSNSATSANTTYATKTEREDNDITAASFTNGVLTLTRGGGNISTAALSAADIPALSAGKITSGTFDADRIPSLAHSKISDTITASSAAPSNIDLAWNTDAAIPYYNYDAKGFITGKGTFNIKLPPNPNVDTTYSAGNGINAFNASTPISVKTVAGSGITVDATSGVSVALEYPTNPTTLGNKQYKVQYGTDSGQSGLCVEVPWSNTTYTLALSGSVLIFTSSSGQVTELTLPST